MKWHEKTTDTLHDERNVKGFFGDYRWLSNFEPCLLEYEGITYQSSEAAYQAAKCVDVESRRIFLNISASECKRLGRKIPIRKDWDSVKIGVMEDILFNKFNKNSYLREKLIGTGNKYLEETNWWGDIFWGVCNGKGQNNLGEILMKIRDVLNSEQNPERSVASKADSSNVAGQQTEAGNKTTGYQ